MVKVMGLCCWMELDAMDMRGVYWSVLITLTLLVIILMMLEFNALHIKVR